MRAAYWPEGVEGLAKVLAHGEPPFGIDGPIKPPTKINPEPDPKQEAEPQTGGENLAQAIVIDQAFAPNRPRPRYCHESQELADKIRMPVACMQCDGKHEPDQGLVPSKSACPSCGYHYDSEDHVKLCETSPIQNRGSLLVEWHGSFSHYIGKRVRVKSDIRIGGANILVTRGIYKVRAVQGERIFIWDFIDFIEASDLVTV